MSEDGRRRPYEVGRQAALAFFGVQREYANSYGLTSETVIIPAVERSSA